MLCPLHLYVPETQTQSDKKRKETNSLLLATITRQSSYESPTKYCFDVFNWYTYIYTHTVVYYRQQIPESTPEIIRNCIRLHRYGIVEYGMVWYSRV